MILSVVLLESENEPPHDIWHSDFIPGLCGVIAESLQKVFSVMFINYIKMMDFWPEFPE